MHSEIRHAWIIGASRGMGKELCKLLSQSAWQVTASARKIGDLEKLAKEINADIVPLDATDKLSIKLAADHVYRVQPPKLVMMNVGDYEPMPIEAFDASLFERLNLTNYLATVYLLDTLIPRMRDNGGGQILLNVSAAAYKGMPQAAPYSAPKAAVLHMAESLKPELERWNIKLRVINPGFVDSLLTQKNTFKMPFLMPPEEAAKRIHKSISKNHFDINFPKRLTWILKLLRCLPNPVWFFFMRHGVLK